MEKLAHVDDLGYFWMLVVFLHGMVTFLFEYFMTSLSSSTIWPDQNTWALYLHIPFCHSICHYCDFAKTSRYRDQEVAEYIDKTSTWFMAFVEGLKLAEQGVRFHSVFFGGGTPGILASEYEPLLDKVRPWLCDGAEISLECNPEDAVTDRPAIWRNLGFNRVSMGVQTFDQKGLKRLTRNHSPELARDGVANLSEHFKNINVDIIYGWPDQGLKSFENDLLVCSKELSVPHLSFYHLIYEPLTPLGRAYRGGRFNAITDHNSEEMWRLAHSILSEGGYDYEEVSNWSQPEFSCRHNWSYWRQEPYLAVGVGAHGLVATPDRRVLRYEFSKHWKKFLNSDICISGLDEKLPSQNDVLSIEQLDGWSFMIDLVGSGLRTREGLDLELLEQISGSKFMPNAIIKRGIDEKLIIMKNRRVFLVADQWFREHAWAGEIVASFQRSL
jgi:oxygen-independent coproporphyrinogen III oxidase